MLLLHAEYVKTALKYTITSRKNSNIFIGTLPAYWIETRGLIPFPENPLFPHTLSRLMRQTWKWPLRLRVHKRCENYGNGN